MTCVVETGCLRNVAKRMELAAAFRRRIRRAASSGQPRSHGMDNPPAAAQSAERNGGVRGKTTQTGTWKLF